MKLKNFGLLFSAILLSGLVFGQEEDEVLDLDQKKEPAPFVIRPTIGLGIGTMHFFGDLKTSLAGQNPLIGQYGLELIVTQPLSKAFDLNFNITRGRLGANQRESNLSLNFISQITTGGVSLTYNFDHILPDDRKIQPELSLGFESLEFLSKTDLLDEFGNRYYFWESDGSIRNLPQSDPDAANAVRVQRDYVYETDIRALNADGFGEYEENTWSIPAGFHVRMQIHPRLSLRVGSTFHYTLTDLIDGITSESTGARKGNATNDMYIMSTAGLAFDLTGKNKEDEEDEGDPFDPMIADEDGDGVVDFYDECLRTPAGMEVDDKGCPSDTDGDGLRDDKDLEIETPDSMIVDVDGVGITDEMAEAQYTAFMDSLAGGVIEDSTYTLDEPDETIRKKYKQFAVKITEFDRPLTDEEANALLSIPNVELVDNGDGTKTLMTKPVGSIEEATKIKGELEQAGIVTEGVISTDDDRKVDDLSKSEKMKADRLDELNKEVDVETGEEIKPEVRPEALGNKYSSSDNFNIPALSQAALMNDVFRVQIGAFKTNLDNNIYENVDGVVAVDFADGITRFYVGSYSTYAEAAAAKIQTLGQGFDDAWVVTFRNGRRMNIQDAGGTVVNQEAMRNDPNFDPSAVKFRVQIGAYTAELPSGTLKKMVVLDNVIQRKQDGETKYLAGEFDNYDEAKNYVDQVIDQFPDAFVVGDQGGSIISAEAAQELKK